MIILLAGTSTFFFDELSVCILNPDINSKWFKTCFFFVFFFLPPVRNPMGNIQEITAHRNMVTNILVKNFSKNLSQLSFFERH